MLHHSRYLNLDQDAIALGIRAGILSAIFSTIYVIYSHNNLNFILAVLGVFIATLVEVVGLKSLITHRIWHGLILSIGAGITVTQFYSFLIYLLLVLACQHQYLAQLCMGYFFVVAP
ncbi:MAG: hypothetical protein K0R94_448 [Burkholderiales bacterium]|nr:hypothetical protein [Burkholderiales bacterium]